jgi:hypothetical protein
MSKELTFKNVRSVIEKHYDTGFPISTWKRCYDKQNYCKYEVFFHHDENSLIVIMTSKQRDCIIRSKFGRFIKSIGGLGYVN